MIQKINPKDPLKQFSPTIHKMEMIHIGRVEMVVETAELRHPINPYVMMVLRRRGYEIRYQDPHVVILVRLRVDTVLGMA